MSVLSRILKDYPCHIKSQQFKQLFKQLLIITLSLTLRGAIFLAKKISRIFLLILWPVKKILSLILRHLILPIYNILHLIKKSGQKKFEESPNKLFLLFTHRYWLSVLIFILTLFILINNYKIRSVAAEDLGKRSLLYKLAQTDEFEENITEEGILNNKKQKPDFLEPQQSILTKHEIINEKINEKTLQNTTAAGGPTDEALVKTNPLSTFTTPESREKIQTYTVQAGDTISSIAAKFGISINTILWANNLSGLSIIRPGDKLDILPVSGILHQVKRGDTLSSIAKKYGVKQDKILSYNKLAHKRLTIGQLIIVPGGEIRRSYKRRVSSFASVFKTKKTPSSQRKSHGFIWPTIGRHITQYYHWRHHAIDIGGMPIGSPIYASMSGKIERAGWGTGYGYHIIINHGGGKKTLYAHLSKIYVKVGQQVTQGTVIGGLGSTGWSTGPHLHFEIRINGRKVNPLSYL